METLIDFDQLVGTSLNILWSGVFYGTQFTDMLVFQNLSSLHSGL